MKILSLILPALLTTAWILWYSLQGRWGEVVLPNIWSVIIITSVVSVVSVIVLFAFKKQKKEKYLILYKETTGNLIAREIYIIERRERSIYAEPK